MGWGRISMSFSFAFPLWPKMLSILWYIYWPLVLLLRIVCAVHLFIYSVCCWFFERLFDLPVYSSSQSLIRCIAGKDFLPFWRLPFQSSECFPSHKEVFSFHAVPLLVILIAEVPELHAWSYYLFLCGLVCNLFFLEYFHSFWSYINILIHFELMLVQGERQ
jgi:hypothetical protein